MLLKFQRPRKISVISAELGLPWYRRFFRTLGLGDYYLACDGVRDELFINDALDSLAKKIAPEDAQRNEVVCSPGQFNIGSSNPGDGVLMPSLSQIRGAGWATVYRLNDGADVSVFRNSGADHISIRDLTIDGNKANQAALVAGVAFTTVTRARLKNLYINDCSGYGAFFRSVTDGWIESTEVRGVGNIGSTGAAFHIGMAGYACTNIHILSVIARDIPHTTCGGIFISHATDVTIAQAICKDIADTGIAAWDNAYGVTIDDYLCRDNAINGIELGASAYVTIGIGLCYANGHGGIRVGPGATRTVIDGAICALNNYHGIHAPGNTAEGDGLTITSCQCFRNSQDAVNTYDGIHLGVLGVTSVEGAIVNNNKCWDGSGAQRWGIIEENGDWNMIIGNWLRLNTTGSLSTVGVNSITVPNIV